MKTHRPLIRHTVYDSNNLSHHRTCWQEFRDNNELYLLPDGINNPLLRPVFGLATLLPNNANAKPSGPFQACWDAWDASRQCVRLFSMFAGTNAKERCFAQDGFRTCQSIEKNPIKVLVKDSQLYRWELNRIPHSIL